MLGAIKILGLWHAVTKDSHDKKKWKTDLKVNKKSTIFSENIGNSANYWTFNLMLTLEPILSNSPWPIVKPVIKTDCYWRRMDKKQTHSIYFVYGWQKGNCLRHRAG